MVIKEFRSPTYNYRFNVDTGFFVRWGETVDDDPQSSPYGPEIADIEISTGDCSAGCPWCYKSNTRGNGQHMSFDTFRHVLDLMPNTLTQVAFGITDADANLDFVAMMDYCRMCGVVPNFTTSGYGMTDGVVAASAHYCGAVAVSVYPHNWDIAWKTAEDLIALGMKQVNVHLLYHADNDEHVRRTLEMASTVKGLNAVVLLGLKPKGRGSNMRPMSKEAFARLVDFASGLGVSIGFDSCSAPKFEAWAGDNDKDDLLQYSERCESSLFSIYVNKDGLAYPCSFSEGLVEPVNMLGATVFLKDVWNSPQFVSFREGLLANDRKCPLYELD